MPRPLTIDRHRILSRRISRELAPSLDAVGERLHRALAEAGAFGHHVEVSLRFDHDPTLSSCGFVDVLFGPPGGPTAFSLVHEEAGRVSVVALSPLRRALWRLRAHLQAIDDVSDEIGRALGPLIGRFEGGVRDTGIEVRVGREGWRIVEAR